jgi:hypothetical protein
MITTIGPKEAAQRAASYFRDLVPEASNIQLEEIEYVEDDGGPYFGVTLSFTILMLGSREYKIFRVGAEKGDVVSMKIRQL